MQRLQRLLGYRVQFAKTPPLMPVINAYTPEVAAEYEIFTSFSGTSTGSVTLGLSNNTPHSDIYLTGLTIRGRGATIASQSTQVTLSGVINGSARTFSATAITSGATAITNINHEFSIPIKLDDVANNLTITISGDTPNECLVIFRGYQI